MSQGDNNDGQTPGVETTHIGTSSGSGNGNGETTGTSAVVPPTETIESLEQPLIGDMDGPGFYDPGTMPTDPPNPQPTAAESLHNRLCNLLLCDVWQPLSMKSGSE